MIKPLPLEQVDPELAGIIQDIARGGKKTGIKSVWLSKNDRLEIIQHPIKSIGKVGRNDPCPVCKIEGKIIKWKKCRKHNN